MYNIHCKILLIPTKCIHVKFNIKIKHAELSYRIFCGVVRLPLRIIWMLGHWKNIGETKIAWSLIKFWECLFQKNIIGRNFQVYTLKKIFSSFIIIPIIDILSFNWFWYINAISCKEFNYEIKCEKLPNPTLMYRKVWCFVR